MFNGGHAPTPAPPRVTSNPDQQAPAPAPRYTGAPPSHTDVTSSGPSYGTPQANAYKATPAYQRAYNAVKTLSGHAGGSDVLSTGGGDYGRAQVQAYRDSQALRELLSGIKISAHVGTETPGGLFGTITAPVGALLKSPLNPLSSSALNIDKNLLGDIKNLPASSIQGLEQIGAAELHDLTHGSLPFEQQATGIQSGAKSELGPLLGAAVTQDPLVQLLSGHPERAWQSASKHPLGAILDVTGLYGLAGKAAGVAARAGMLGDEAQAAAQLAREARPLLPGMAQKAADAGVEAPGLATRARSWSPNLFTQGIQKALEGRLLGKSQKFTAARTAHDLRQAVALDHAANQGGRAADIHTLVDTMKSIKPKGAEEANVAPLVASFGTGGTGSMRAMLQNILTDLIREPDKVGATADTAAKLEQQLREALAKPQLDEASVNHAVTQYATLRGQLDRQLADTGLRSQEELQNAVQKRYMLQQPDVHFLDKSHAIQDPRLQQAVKDAAGVLRQRKLDLETALKEQANSAGAHAGASRAVADVTRKMPVSYVTDNVMNHLLDTRDAIESSRLATKGDHAAQIKFAREAVKDAERSVKEAVRTAKTQKLYGTLVEDPAVPPVRGKLLKGMRVRPMTETDFTRLASREPAPLSFVSMRNPLREAIPDLRSTLGGRSTPPAEVGRKAYTGEAIKAGDVLPGWGGMVRSGLDTIDELWRQRELQGFADRYMDPRAFTTEQDAIRAAQEYTKEQGIKMETVQWNGQYRNVPEAALTELRRQFQLDRPGKLGRLLTKPNNIFRKTVLPYSPKLPIMHNVENVSRIMAMEGDPIRALFRAPIDYARGRAMLNATTGDGERAKLETLATPGGLSRSGAAGEAEDLGRMPADNVSPVRALASRSVGLFDKMGTQIIHFQRALERHAQIVALGAHGRQLLQEWGHGWVEANTAVTKYADDLARGLADPNEAARAARFMHKALGQYNAFTANSRLALRTMPFGSWYINAARLVLVTLPKDHPMYSALIQDVNNSQELKWNAQHAGLPSDLQTAVNVGPNAWLDVGKLTPIGLPNQNPVATVAQLAVPWASGSLLALAGKDPFMADLKGPGTAYGQSASPSGVESGGAGTRQALLSAAEQGAESLGGPLNLIARLVEGHGGTFYNTDAPLLHMISGGLLGSDAIKKGSTTQQKGLLNLPGPLDKVLDPFHPTTFHSKARGTGGVGGLPAPASNSSGPAGSGIGGLPKPAALTAARSPLEYGLGPQGGLFYRSAQEPDSMPGQPPSVEGPHTLSRIPIPSPQAGLPRGMSQREWQRIHGIIRDLLYTRPEHV